MFKQITVRHISEEVFDQIKAAILEGKLKPGQKLPTERELMGQLGVSRVPIREALKLLSNMGFIETTQGGGSYVKALLAHRVKDPLTHIIGEELRKKTAGKEAKKEEGRGRKEERLRAGLDRTEVVICRNSAQT